MQKGTMFDIPGTVLSIKNAQLLVSSGTHSLDELIGGGLPVGTITLLEEDTHGVYASTLFKYFLAEGILHKHGTFIATLDKDPNKIINELPAPIERDPEPDVYNPPSLEKLKIAFRYQNLPTSNKSEDDKSHHYDLSRKMALSEADAANIECWQDLDQTCSNNMFSNPSYYNLLRAIKNKIVKGKYQLTDKPKQRNVLRIGIHALGSPLWSSTVSASSKIDWIKDLRVFFYYLRAIVRQAFAVAFVSIPSHLYEGNSINRCVHSSDIALRLEAFAGTDLESNQYLSEYHGYFHVNKLAAINSLTSLIPAKVEYVFQLRRKKFVVKTLHLPPDLQEVKDDAQKRGPVSLGCGSSDKHLLEF